jgi:3-methyladenine DNA glycosylase/8-oxoguanine DNA glycosylase
MEKLNTSQADPPQSVSFRYPKPEAYDTGECFKMLALGPADPSFSRIDERGWKILRWVNGQLCRVVLGCGASTLGVQVDGPAASAVLDGHARALLGLDDQASWSLPPGDPLVPYLRAKPGLRLVRAFWLYEGALTVVLSQRVSWAEAVSNWQRLCRRFGEEFEGMSSAPSPQRMGSLTLAQLASCGIEAKRARALKEVALRLRTIPPVDLSGDQVERMLEGCRGVGPWTKTMLRAQFWGDSDAVPLGDYGLPDLVCRALAGERKGSDQRMLELLHPYQGERFRVIRYLMDAGPRTRRGPRLPIGQGLGR